MGTKGFVSTGVLTATAGLLLGAVILTGTHRASAPVLEGSFDPADILLQRPAPPPQPTWDPATTLLKKQDGSWVVPWGTIRTFIARHTFDTGTGEPNHKLKPSGRVTASIAPVKDIWTRPVDELAPGRFLARIRSSGDHDELGLVRGVNYLFVWGSPAAQTGHLLVLSEQRRTEIALNYTPHGDISRRQAQEAVDARTRQPTWTLSISALTCIAKGYKACFVDSQDEQITSGAGAMLGLSEAQGGNSQPWVACVTFGCCCGGTQCHK